jgi:FkbM family methyltransferase
LVANLLDRARHLVRPLVHRRLHRPEIRRLHTVYGSDYGGWPVLEGSIDSRSVVYSFGVGEDVSFDLAVIDRFGASVHAFDPTPKSKAWIAQQHLPSRFHFHDYGIAASDGEVQFYPPANPEHVSYSVRPGSHERGHPVTRPVHRLSTIMGMLGQTELQVLKMDIEGFEYDVIDNILDDEILPPQLLVEFHHGLYGISNERTTASVARLRDAGYRIFYVSAVGREYGFARA